VQQLNCVLVDINYRGSTGYTEALSSLAGKIESGAMSDVLCVMDYVKQHVPQAKFALYGHSFGGYLASLILTSEHSEKFCGGVSASGFYDWQEDFKFITDKQGEAFAISNFRSRFGFVPSIDKEQATKLSITSRLKELKVPLHVVHGGKDDTCPLAQVQLLETAKKQTSQSLLDIHIFENADHSFSPEDKDSANEAFKGMLAFYRKIGC
jgi:dipeptidyl aminopeptidase/acylaminoacyl peptidase